jgi:hypothetical protein
MSESDRIVEQLKKSLDGEAWHGPALFELLKDVSAVQATSRPIPDAHTIWEIVTHLTAWATETLALYHDPSRARMTPEQNFPPTIYKLDDNAWPAAQNKLRQAHDAWYHDLATINEPDLYLAQQDIYPSIYEILHGLVQHTAYHAGQIVLLKKML